MSILLPLAAQHAIGRQLTLTLPTSNNKLFLRGPWKCQWPTDCQMRLISSSKTPPRISCTVHTKEIPIKQKTHHYTHPPNPVVAAPRALLGNQSPKLMSSGWSRLPTSTSQCHIQAQRYAAWKGPQGCKWMRMDKWLWPSIAIPGKLNQMWQVITGHW